MTDKALEFRRHYEENKSTCNNCGHVLPFEKRKNKFCSHSCSASVTNIGRIVARSHREKSKKSAKAWIARHPELVKRANTVECQECGKIFASPPAKKAKFCSQACAYVGKDKSKYGGHRCGSGRGKKGWYKGYWCDSSWELAWVIHSIEHGQSFVRNTEGFEYFYKEKIHKYYPDFLMKDGSYVEVKGYESEQWKAKKAQFPRPLKVITKSEMLEILNWVVMKYGLNFTELYEGSRQTKLNNLCKECGNPCKNVYCSRHCSGKGVKKMCDSSCIL